MKAMILAAGLGTRLRPLTGSRPKALVEVDGRPLLDHVLHRLIAAGCSEIIINTHHFPEQIAAYLAGNRYAGVRIELSHEPALLDTGGGLRKAAWFLQGNDPFILHNVDVLSNLDLQAMLQRHRQSPALATVAVRTRKTNRYFLFDRSGRLVGWRQQQPAEEKLAAHPDGEVHQRSFMGIHIISPDLFGLLTETGRFSIVDAYLRLAGEGRRIQAFPADKYDWLDLGRPENLPKAKALLQKWRQNHTARQF